MEYFVIGVVATGFFIRSIIKSTQSWDGLARNLGYKKVEPFRLEGRHHGLRVVIEQIPGQKQGTQTTELRITTAEGWPSELIIHSQSPRSGLLPFIPSGTMQKIDSALFALRYVVLNVPISKEISTRIMSLPNSELFFASKDEFRFVFTNKSYPSPVEIRKLLFQLHTVMKKIKSTKSLSVPSSIEPPEKTSFMDVDYKGLLQTMSHQVQDDSRPILSRVQTTNSNPSSSQPNHLEDSDDVEDSYEKFDARLLDEPARLEDVDAPTSKEESTLIDFHKALGEFGVTSLVRDSLIQQFSISTIHVVIEEVRPTFELGMPDGFRKGVTVFGLTVKVPVCIYIPQSQKQLWIDKQRGEEYNLSVRVYSYDVLRKRLVFLAN